MTLTFMYSKRYLCAHTRPSMHLVAVDFYNTRIPWRFKDNLPFDCHILTQLLYYFSIRKKTFSTPRTLVYACIAPISTNVVHCRSKRSLVHTLSSPVKKSNNTLIATRDITINVVFTRSLTYTGQKGIAPHFMTPGHPPTLAKN